MKAMTKYKDIGVQEAHARLGELVLIDVREPYEIIDRLGHIRGIKNIPLGELLAGGSPAGLRTDAQILVICRSGARSARAALALSAWGFENVYNLAGGMMAWSAAGLPTQHGPLAA